MAENQSTVENAKEKLDRWLKDGITTPGGKLPSERELGELLGRRGIALRAGLHCAPLAHRTAGTLESGTLRASVSAFTLPEEIGRALAITEELLREEAV